MSLSREVTPLMGSLQPKGQPCYQARFQMLWDCKILQVIKLQRRFKLCKFSYLHVLLSESRAIINDLEVILHGCYKSFIPWFSELKWSVRSFNTENHGINITNFISIINSSEKISQLHEQKLNLTRLLHVAICPPPQ